MIVSKIDKALDLAARGFAVFPLAPGTKIPLAGSSGITAATLDPWEITNLWAANPDANIGIAPGASVPPLVVVDVDGPEGHAVDGRPEAERLAAIGELPPTFTVETPSGGRHLYYRLAEPLVGGTALLAPGLDVQGVGRHVVAPGEIVGGKPYKVVAESEISFATPALVAKLRAPRVAGSPSEWLVEPDLEPNIRRAQDWIETVAPASEGERNNTAFKTAAVLRDFGLSEAKSLDLLKVWNASNQPPLDSGELSLANWSAYKNAQNAAGSKAASTEIAALLDAAKNDPEPKPIKTKAPIDWWMYRDQMKNLPPPKWLVQDTITDASVCLVYGAWGGGKTLMCLDMALSIATGRKWAGKTCSLGTVAYVTGEGVRGIDTRISAWEAANEVEVDRTRFLFCPRMPNWGDNEQLGLWGKELKAKAPKLDLLIIDTLSRAMAGWGDENNTADAATFMMKVEELRDALGSAIILVHHTGTAGHRSRGSDEYPQKADTILRTDHEGEGLGLVTTVKMLKQKDGEPWKGSLQFRTQQAGAGVILEQVEKSGQPAKERTQSVVWLAEAIRVLKATAPENLPIKKSHLAEEMARGLMPEGNVAPLIDAISRWLISPVAEREGLAPYVSIRSSANTPTAFGLPKTV